MTDKLDPRLLQVSIEIDGRLKIYKDAWISASGEKSGGAKQDACVVKIYNLDKETRNYILTETSPFNKNRTTKRLIVEAGRVSIGLSTVFVGDITESKASQPPDIAITLKAATGNAQKGVIVSHSYPATTSLQGIAQTVAGDLGAALDFQAPDKLIASEAYSGGALKQIDRLGAAGGVDAYLDGDKLIVKQAGAPLVGRLRQVSSATGMIGLPEATDKGVKVKVLFDPATVLGGAIKVQSDINPSLNGLYTIFKLNFDLSNRDKPFYQNIEATRNG